jgi:hypothetical protein
MNTIQFWLVDTIVKHKIQRSNIRLDDEEDVPDDMLIPDGDYEDDDAASLSSLRIANNVTKLQNMESELELRKNQTDQD